MSGQMTQNKNSEKHHDPITQTVGIQSAHAGCRGDRGYVDGNEIWVSCHLDDMGVCSDEEPLLYTCLLNLKQGKESTVW